MLRMLGNLGLKMGVSRAAHTQYAYWVWVLSDIIVNKTRPIAVMLHHRLEWGDFFFLGRLGG